MASPASPPALSASLLSVKVGSTRFRFNEFEVSFPVLSVYRPRLEKLTFPPSTLTALISSTIYSSSASSSLFVTVPKLKVGSVPALKEPLVAVISQSGLALESANV